MPRPKRTSEKKPNYTEVDPLKEMDEIESDGQEEERADVGDVGEKVEAMAMETDAETIKVEAKGNGSNGDVTGTQPESQSGEVEPEPDHTSNDVPNPSTPPPKQRSPSPPHSDEDGGEFVPEPNEDEEDVKMDIKPKKGARAGSGSPTKRKATASAGPGSPTKVARVVKKSGSPSASAGGKFVTTPENRTAILQEMLKQVSPAKIDWNAIAEVTGDQPGKLSKVSSPDVRGSVMGIAS